MDDSSAETVCQLDSVKVGLEEAEFEPPSSPKALADGLLEPKAEPEKVGVKEDVL